VSGYLMIPGAGGAAWVWHRVAPLLEAAGHEAIALDLPGDDEQAGLPEYARLAVSAVGQRDDVIVVAQSLGGFTAPLVATMAPVRALVLVNAMIPAPHETPGEWWANTGWSQAQTAAAEEGGYATELDPVVYFLHDVPPEVVATGETHQRAEGEAVFGSACDFDVWPSIPIKVVVGAEDRMFPAEFQRKLARDRLGVEADVLPGGHLIGLSQPTILAEYLLRV
jgi:pimeloyl-ACP methyl ester carboxylesterase